MKPDIEGFMYPYFDKSTCIDCGLCEKSCPVINQNEPQKPISVYAAINPDEDIREKSSSGGVFTVLAEKVIEEGGVVFGAKFNNCWEVVHGYVEVIEELEKLRGSKYVQSRIGSTYREVESFLKTGKKVLFSGTPCQVAGLYRYLHKYYDNLITVDFICHGVPSPGVWSKYLNEVVIAGKQAILDVGFRNKSKGWKRFSFALDMKKNSDTVSMLSPVNKNPYMSAFLHDLILRPSCYQCPVKGGKSCSDITIADFWGVQNVNPNIDDDKGTSLVLVNTEKGKSAIPFDNLHYEVSTGDALKYNSAYYKAANMNPRRFAFFTSLEKGENLHQIIEETLRPSAKQRIKQLLNPPIQFAKKSIMMMFGRRSKPRIEMGNYDEFHIQKQELILIPASIDFRDKRNGWKHYMLRIDMTIIDGE